MSWWPPDRREICSALIVLAVFAAFVFFMMNQDGIRKTNSGFDPEWDCKQQGYGDPVCVKRSRTAD